MAALLAALGLAAVAARAAESAAARGVLPPLPAISAAPPTACDRLANVREHPNSVVSGDVGFLKIDAAAAIQACREATAVYPNVRRFAFFLARAYQRGGQLKLARRYYLLAAERGDPFAMISLAGLHLRGEGGPVDLAAAAAAMRQAAATGHPQAVAHLSRYHRLGLGLPYGPDEAFRLAKSAAASGWPFAMAQLVHILKHGIGTPKDTLAAEIIARRLFPRDHAAALGGDVGAMLRVAWALHHGDGVDRDHPAAVRWVRKAIIAGHPGASHALGWMYRNGHGVARNPEAGCDYYDKSTAARPISSVNNLGLCFEEGKGREQDYARARELFEYAAARGDAFAARNLARLYENGRSVPKDIEKAVGYYRLAAERGHAAAMLTYAWYLDRGEGVTADPERACDWYERAMARGNAAATNNLAICYEGRGRTQDLDRAIQLFEKAAANGNVLAIRNLAVRYDEGRGVDQDHVRANRLFAVAAAEGNLTAMVRLGFNTFEGHGTARDVTAGCDWFARAAEQGNATAMNNLATCLVTGVGREKDIPRGLKLFEKAVAKDNALAMRNLAGHLFDGEIVEQDRARANQLYQRAAEAGDIAAIYSYAFNLFWGHGITKNAVAACRWFDKAAANDETHAIAKAYIGYCWEKGLGRKRSALEAFRAWRLSAEAGNPAGMQSLARAYDEAIGVTRSGQNAALWLRRSLAVGNVRLARELISAPHVWHPSTRKALQRIMRDEGHYKGALDGRFTAAMDDALWNHAVDTGARPRAAGANGSSAAGANGSSAAGANGSSAAGANGLSAAGAVGQHAASAAPVAAGKAAMTGPPRLRQEFVRVPVKGAPRGLLVRICRAPDAAGPERLIVINHGLTSDLSRRRRLRPGACGAIAEYFAGRGFVVAYPVRRGYGETAGVFTEDASSCNSRRFIRAGREIARDIGAVVRNLTRQPGIRSTGALVMGHSGGGWGTAALAAQNPDAVAGYINFSGGHGSHKGTPGTYCPRSLTVAASSFGRTAKKPVLWLYVQNDTYIGPAIARRMFQAFKAGSGKPSRDKSDTTKSELVILPPFADDGHYIFNDDAFDLWRPVIDRWLAQHLPAPTE